ncbi:MAG: hypothetical protein IT562_08180 [Alphaproteobacteria bacterium]|nr:hypothetical protein [Alphaproteobacteria bacterium]
MDKISGALLPADTPGDDAPRFAAVMPSTSSTAMAERIMSRLERESVTDPNADAAPPQIGRALLARDIDNVERDLPVRNRGPLPPGK